MLRNEFLEQLSAAPNPSYVIDEVALTKNMQLFHELEKRAEVNVLCALKGFAMWSVFPLMNKYISGATASSLNEARLCNEEFGVKSHSCFVVYLEEEFEEVLKLSSHITFNSLSQYQKFLPYIKENPQIQFALRVNPEFSQVEVEKYNPCMPGSRFGILLNDLPNSLPEGITGLHIHALCESSAEELHQLTQVLDEKIGHLLHECHWVNLGGGHHITKKNYDTKLIESTLKSFKNNYNLKSLMIEPGEAMGWQTGVLLSRIEDIIYSENQKILMLNVSFAAHMPDCLEMPYQPSVYGEIKIGEDSAKFEKITLGGNTCMSGDFIEGFDLPKNLKVGDSILFEDMTHYTFVKNTTFNGVPLPALAKVTQEDKLEVIRTFGYDDFKYRLS